MNFRERIRVFSERFLDMAGFTSSPREQSPYRMSNDLQRSLAHLAAFDGQYSRLVRALESGVLRVSAEGNKNIPLGQDISGPLDVNLRLVHGLSIDVFSGGTLVTLPIWGGETPGHAILHTATGASTTTYDFVDATNRCVLVGPVKRDLVVYESETPADLTRPLCAFTTESGEPRIGHTAYRYLDFVNAGADVDVLVRAWT